MENDPGMAGGEVDPEAIVSYLLARVEMLTNDNEDLRQQVETLQTRVNELESTTEAEATAKSPDPATPPRPRAPSQDPPVVDANDVETKVIEASRLMASAMLMDPGKQPNLNYRGRKFMMALRAKEPNWEKVRELLEADPELREMRSLNQEGTRGFTALHVMAMEGRTAAAEKLIRDFGFDPYATDLFGRTALHVAAAHVKTATADMLSRYMGPSHGENAPVDASGTTPAGHTALSKLGTPAARTEALKALHREVFDGHGGKAAAEFCADLITSTFTAREEVQSGAAASDAQAAAKAVQETIQNLDLQLLGDRRFRAPTGANDDNGPQYEVRNSSGTTATVAIVTPTHVILGNVGDSRTIVFSSDTAAGPLLRTRDHCKPGPDANEDDNEFWRQEVARVEAAGGMVDERGRVYYDTEDTSTHLAMTRALGDVEFKQGNRGPDMNAVAALPEVYARKPIPSAPKDEPSQRVQFDLNDEFDKLSV
ncbi:Protein phosphatase, putative [Hondaea fermentalgiana]|uniref:Protein phosphatase, putative n=1 Tax=Hondaea fermentalgiana TaxID=2315210 RepID=A0A2R5GTS4_9STRA|nr:Protein phosphatase, putative [Hondaea fermentalgiana]|eukprot:GBG34277.1 Protein phosphatase, putative [Hondaea fermentalgiana]